MPPLVPGVILNVIVPEPVPTLLVAVTVALNVPVGIGVPEITPVLEIVRLAGCPDIVNAVGLFVADTL